MSTVSLQTPVRRRFVYQAYLGLFVIVCWGFADLAQHWRISRAWLAAPAAVVLVALTIVSNRQIGYWSDNLTLWTHAMQVNKYHWLARDNVGMYLKRRGKTLEAIEYYQQAAAINPADRGSNSEIGLYDQIMGDPRDAITHYQLALLDPTSPEDFQHLVWQNMGVAYRDLGDKEKAMECFRRSTSLEHR